MRGGHSSQKGVEGVHSILWVVKIKSRNTYVSTPPSGRYRVPQAETNAMFLANPTHLTNEPVTEDAARLMYECLCQRDGAIELVTAGTKMIRTVG